MMSNDRTVSLSCIAAIGLWVATALFLVSGLILGTLIGGEQGLFVAGMLSAHGLACSAGAATVTICDRVRRQGRMFRNAFELGQDASAIPIRRAP